MAKTVDLHSKFPMFRKLGKQIQLYNVKSGYYARGNASYCWLPWINDYYPCLAKRKQVGFLFVVST